MRACRRPCSLPSPESHNPGLKQRRPRLLAAGAAAPLAIARPDHREGSGQLFSCSAINSYINARMNSLSCVATIQSAASRW
jgi:hypothetical protein